MEIIGLANKIGLPMIFIFVLTAHAVFTCQLYDDDDIGYS